MKINSLISRENTRNRNTSDCSPEEELLLNCTRFHNDASTAENIAKLVEEKIDWSYLNKMAVHNKVIPLLHNGLISTCPDAIPKNFLDDLSDRVKMITAHNQSCIGEMLDISKLFDKNNIPMIPFKGVTFSLFVYGNVNLRQCGDIDLLVRRSDFLKAKDLLVRNGYHHMYFGVIESSHVQAQLMRDDKKFSLDLHYGLTPHYHHANIQEARMGKRSKSGDWNRLDTDATNWFFSWTLSHCGTVLGH